MGFVGAEICAILCVLFATTMKLINAYDLYWGICDDLRVNCQCGSGTTVSVRIRRCSVYYRWKTICQPCKNFNKEALCSKFQRCAKCERGACISCLSNRYGDDCLENCQCQNGAECQKKDGICICPKGYSGRFCENHNGLNAYAIIGCPPPTTIQNGHLQIFTPFGTPVTTTEKLTTWGANISPVNRNFLSKLKGLSTTVSPWLLNGVFETYSQVRYTCNFISRNTIGSFLRTCLPNNQWSGEDPRCQASCGRTNFAIDLDIERPTYHPSPSTVGRWPWQVAISSWRTYHNSYEMECSGTLISQNMVLTAAHCVTEMPTSEPRPVGSFILHLGKYFYSSQLDDFAVVQRKVESIVVHPSYRYRPSSPDSDIALINLDSPVQFSNRISPICLPQPGEGDIIGSRKRNIMGVIVGWGKDAENRNSEHVNQLALPVVDNRNCGDYNVTVTPNMFCAGLNKGIRILCGGISGGPFLTKVDTINDEIWTQEGIISFGSRKQCEESTYYLGFVKLYNFVEWINEHTA